MGKTGSEIMAVRRDEEPVTWNMNLAEDSPWLINRSATVPREERTGSGSVERYNEYRNGSLSARFHTGIPTARAIKTLAVVLGEAQKAGWKREIHIRLAELLQKLNLKDTGPNRKTVRLHLRVWEGAVLKYSDNFHDGIQWGLLRFNPIVESGWISAGEKKGYFRIRLGETFLAMAKNRDARHINLDMQVYPYLASGYSLRLYELLSKNLTFRDPHADGIIRWFIGAKKLQDKFAVDLPFKEFLRNIRSGVDELEKATRKSGKAAGWNISLRVENARDGWGKAVIYFETDRRLDYNEITRQVEAVPAVAHEETPSSKLAGMIMAEIRKDDPVYPEDNRKAWKQVAEDLIKAGRKPETIWNVWRTARGQWKTGSEYHARLTVNPFHFKKAFTDAFTAASTPKKGKSGSPLLAKVDGMLRSGELTMWGPVTSAPGPTPEKPETSIPEVAQTLPPRTTEDEEREGKLQDLIHLVYLRWPEYDARGLTREMAQAAAEWALQNNCALPENKAEMKALVIRLAEAPASADPNAPAPKSDRKEQESGQEKLQEGFQKPQEGLRKDIQKAGKDSGRESEKAGDGESDRTEKPKESLHERIARLQKGELGNPYTLTEAEERALKECVKTTGNAAPKEPRRLKEFASWCVNNPAQWQKNGQK